MLSLQGICALCVFHTERMSKLSVCLYTPRGMLQAMS